MKVLTLNTWGTHGPPERLPILTQALQTLDPEILCLQEVTDERLLSFFTYPTRLYAPTGGLAILSRFPMMSHEVVTFSARSPLELHLRQALLAKLAIGNVPLWIATTHLAWKAEDEASREAQVEELLKKLASFTDPILFSGDLNAEPNSSPIRRILESGFVDLFSLLNPKEPGISWDNLNPFIQSHEVKFPNRRIDYLFLRPGSPLLVTPESCEVVLKASAAEGLYPSDHYGVMATFADRAIARGEIR